MKHRFKSRVRRSDKAQLFIFDHEVIAVEYRQRLKCYDLIYHPDMNKTIGIRRFIRVVKYRSKDHLEILGLVVKTLDSLKSIMELESRLKFNISIMQSDPCA